MAGPSCIRMSQRVASMLKCFLLSATALNTLVLCGFAAWTYVENGLLYPCPEKPDTLMDPWQHHHYITTPLLRVFIAMLGALVMEFYSASAHLRLASWLGVVNWHSQTGIAASVLPQCYGVDPDTSSKAAWAPQTGIALWSICAAGWMLCLLYWVSYQVWLRLEIVSGGHRRKAWRRTSIAFFASTLLAGVLVAVIRGWPGVSPVWSHYILISLLIPLVLAARFVCLIWSNVRLLLGARHAASRAPPGRAQRVQLATRTVLVHFAGNIAAALSKALFLCLQFLMLKLTPEAKVEKKLLQRSYDLVSLVDLCFNTCLILALAGVLSGAGRSARLKRRAARARHGRWRRNREEWQQRGAVDVNVHVDLDDPKPDPIASLLQWDEKVRELAGRGVSLDALLQFYRQTLPGVMPHFDPQRHTTGNVVFEAVIPYTSEQGCAAADLMMAGHRVLPQKMVTHNWGNKFSALLAAIVSDAIGESDFGMVAWLLVHDLDRLEAWIADLKVGFRTYWICAFAVNQHASICGSRGQVCRCNRQKFLNDSPPLMPDGSSIPCEVNKFDQMMRYLSAQNPAFEQVVAVDAKCDLFWRAWCISEIATAHETGMPQSLKVTSPDCLEANMKKIGQLKIEDMEASRKEDKELILSRIESPDDFNRTLRHVLLNEVIPAWSSLDASEQMSLAGCVVRWQRVAQETGDLAVWAA